MMEKMKVNFEIMQNDDWRVRFPTAKSIGEQSWVGSLALTKSSHELARRRSMEGPIKRNILSEAWANQANTWLI